MSEYRVAYRLRIYASRSVDPTETTVLVPAAGAPHADPFQVATITGVAGYQPYLDPPRGRRGRIDLRSRSLDVGTLTFTLVDKRLSDASNLVRWWTAFFGDAKGRPRGKLRVEADESLNGGSTWALFFTGRLVASAIDAERARVFLTVQDEVDSLKMDVFVGPPHPSITYAAIPTLLPLGVVGSSYGVLQAAAPMTGATKDYTVAGTAWQAGTVKVVELDATSAGREDNLVTKNLFETVAPNDVIGGSAPGTRYGWAASLPNFSGTCRARVKHLTGALAGYTGDYKVAALTQQAFGSPQHYHVTAFAIQALPTNDRGYLALPAVGVSVEVYLFVDDVVSRDRPLLLNDVDPATLLQDLCDGKFGYLFRDPEPLPAGKAYGDPKRTVVTNGLAAFVGIHPPFRGRITSREHLIDWIEDNLLKQYHWALYLDRAGRLNLVDLRLPSSLAGIPTLTDDDLATGQPLSWEHDPTSAITRVEFTRYFDRVSGATALLSASEAYPKIPSGGIIEEFEHPLIVLDIGSADFGDEPYAVDATGYRAMSGEELQGQSRIAYLQNKLIELSSHLRRPWGYGTTTIGLPCRRTATVTGLVQGSLVLVAASHVPDPTTYARGGTRLCRVLEVSEDGPLANLTLIDLAVNDVSAVPTVGQPAQEAGNTYSGITTALTLNAAGQPAEVRYAVTDTSVGTAPLDASPLWVVAGYFRSSQTVIIRNLPPGKRAWVQARTLPDAAVEPQVPSAWILAGGTGRVDTAALPVPTTLTVPAKTNVSATLQWVNTATDLLIEILLMTPVGDPRVRIATVPNGGTRFEIRDLAPSTTYRAEVRYALGQHHGVGVTVDFTTNATGTAAPAIAGIQILRL